MAHLDDESAIRGMGRRLAVVASSIVGATALLTACGSSTPSVTYVSPLVRQAIVPVVVQASPNDLTTRVRGATVGIVNTASGVSLGVGTTGREGVVLVRLSTLTAPATLTVTASGGRTVSGVPFSSATLGSTTYASPHAVYVVPPAPAGGALPSTTTAQLTSTLSQANWLCEATTTAGFASFFGFKMGSINVPSTNCPTTTRQTDSPPTSPGVVLADRTTQARPALTGAVTDVLGIGISTASAAYSIGSGTGSSQQLSAIQKTLSTMEGQLDDINQAVDSLQTSVAQISAQVNAVGESSSAQAAGQDVNDIKSASNDVEVLVAAAIQLLCPSGTCAQTPATTFTSALETTCPPSQTQTSTCENFVNVMHQTQNELAGTSPGLLAKLGTIALDAIGSASGGGPAATPGVVQYALASEQGSAGFYQTSDAANARVDWAYYLLVTQVAQVSVAVAGSLDIGQPQPGTSPTDLYPTTVQWQDVATQVDKVNPIVDAYLGAFPNFPDTAVMTTGSGLPDGDAPYLFPQQVGAVVTSGVYTGNAGVNFDLSANGTTGSPNPAIKGQNGNQLALTWSGGSAPIVMTPLGTVSPNTAGATGTWQLLPSSPSGTPPPVPTMTAVGFQNWQFATATGPNTNSNSQPNWTGSSVSWSANSLSGPLSDLYYWVHDDNTPGQAMSSASGIAEQLLFPQGQTYGSSGSNGLSYYYTRTQTSDANAAVGIEACSPSGNSSCLLPTWLTTSVNATNNNPGNNSGVFDFNNGVALDNQNVANPIGEACTNCADGQAWLNTYGNWESNWTPDGNGTQTGIVSTLNGSNITNSGNPAFNTAGRPVLFDRQQVSGGSNAETDCFYWTASTNPSAATGTGCLVERLTSSAVLPAVSSSY